MRTKEKSGGSGAIYAACSWMALPLIATAVLFFASTPLQATLIITPTFDASLTVADQTAINAAISVIEADITSPNNISVSIYYTAMTSGLGESFTSQTTQTYYDFYSALAPIDATGSANQQTALTSLGAVPSMGSSNPVNTSVDVVITSAEGRNIGIATPGQILPNSDINLATCCSGTYDSEIGLNTGITSPPGTLNGSTYDLETVAEHETDEVLGIGGPGSTIGGGSNDPVGDLDLFRYDASGVRSYSAFDASQPYFSINGGATVLAYFNQEGGGSDYADWESNPLPAATNPEVQDAFGTPGLASVLGSNEITALNVIGYTAVTPSAPEPSTGVFLLSALLAGFLVHRHRRAP